MHPLRVMEGVDYETEPTTADVGRQGRRRRKRAFQPTSHPLLTSSPHGSEFHVPSDLPRGTSPQADAIRPWRNEMEGIGDEVSQNRGRQGTTDSNEFAMLYNAEFDPRGIEPENRRRNEQNTGDPETMSLGSDDSAGGHDGVSNPERRPSLVSSIPQSAEVDLAMEGLVDQYDNATFTNREELRHDSTDWLSRSPPERRQPELGPDYLGVHSELIEFDWYPPETGQSSMADQGGMMADLDALDSKPAEETEE